MKNGDTIECVVTSNDSASGAEFKNVLHFRVTATAGTIGAWTEAVGNSFRRSLQAAVPGIEPNQLIELYPKTFRWVNFQTANLDTPDEQGDYLPTTVGSLTAQSYDPRASVLLRLKTGLRGKSRRGFVYMPPPAENYIGSGGTVNRQALLIYHQWALDLKVLGTAEEQGLLVVYSRTLSTQSIVFNTAVSTVNVAGLLSSQRRRRRHVL